jgi:hypothetical protein
MTQSGAGKLTKGEAKMLWQARSIIKELGLDRMFTPEVGQEIIANTIARALVAAERRGFERGRAALAAHGGRDG